MVVATGTGRRAAALEFAGISNARKINGYR
jgi:hypothetical protein